MPALVCWKCGASLAELSLPLQRLDECKQCHAELHVCKLCEWYSTAVAKHCREPIAEEVNNKERTNYCDYYKPRMDAYSDAGVTAAAQAKAGLDALFGGGKPPAESTDAPRAALDALFGKK